MPTPLLGKSDLLRFERVGLETHPPLVVNMMAVCKIKIDQFILLFKPCTNPQVSVSDIIMHFKISISLKIFTRYDRLQRACSTYKLLQIVWTIRYLKTWTWLKYSQYNHFISKILKIDLLYEMGLHFRYCSYFRWLFISMISNAITDIMRWLKSWMNCGV